MTTDATPAPILRILDVEGMTCASCVNRIERYLRKVDGVVEANVNRATEQASVTASSEVGLERLLEAIEAAGYDARLAGDAGAAPTRAPASPARRAS